MRSVQRAERTPRASWWEQLRSLETFRAVRNNPSYRLYWCGAFTSNVGNWMKQVAQGWLVYQLTGSPFMLGLVGAANMAPVLLFSLYGGVLADQIERRRLMIWTQSGMMLLAFLLAWLTLTGLVTIWHVLVIAFLHGCVNAFNTPVRQSIISDLVRKEDLSNAVAINSTQFQLSRSLGPALAGAVLAAAGPGWCFLVNGILYVAVIWTLWVIKVPALPPRPRRSAIQSIRDGVAYARGAPTIFALLLIAGIPSLFGRPYETMLPAFAETVLEAGPTGLGILQSAAGVGAVAGALLIASIRDSQRSGMLMIGCVMALGFGLEAFGLSRNYGLSIVLVFFVGLTTMAYAALNQTFLQHLIADEMRGRVMSLLTLTTFGLQPFGSMLTGALASVVGVQVSMVICGCICVLSALYVIVRWPILRSLR
jgi:MFS family permease